jgi:thioredoxin 1
MKRIKIINVSIFAVLLFFLAACGDKQTSQTPVYYTDQSTSVPVKGMVTMVDLGADKCAPCKLMAPILLDLEEEYQGRVAIIFLDVWKDKKPADHFGVRAIPTQIFFDATGKERYRHLGFLSKESIVAQLKKMGIK